MTILLLVFVSVVSLIMAFAAWRRARQTAQRLDQLTQMYWELKYQYGELRQRPQGPTDAAPSVPAAAEFPGGFVPLASLKR